MRTFLPLLAILLLTPPANAAVRVSNERPAAAHGENTAFLPASELSRNRAMIEKLEAYLSGISTIVSEFTQVAPDGTLTSGKFYLQRPGKMRWQYNPPTPILMVANGSELVYYDYELDQISHIPLDSTLIGFLAQDKISFGGIVGVTGFERTPGAVRVSVSQRERPADGELTLEFAENPLTLRNMVVRDATGQVTTVSLNDARFDVPLDKELFVFREPGRGKRVKIH